MAVRDVFVVHQYWVFLKQRYNRMFGWRLGRLPFRYITGGILGARDNVEFVHALPLDCVDACVQYGSGAPVTFLDLGETLPDKRDLQPQQHIFMDVHAWFGTELWHAIYRQHA
ncbi:uncharacterized protein EMH_0018010 [Eimeria mitis]|uniref:Uncharacterized protein n=1 Tax=Eimeria mitis TaxID=44415 RepID=U6K7F5_9EIME|nr:uncharacterized protein EMH_0018010 [Eimeria mitis]CDJ33930.1 hypothetical protein EMH_0018010 [Eimeria mitis]